MISDHDVDFFFSKGLYRFPIKDGSEQDMSTSIKKFYIITHQTWCGLIIKPIFIVAYIFI